MAKYGNISYVIRGFLMEGKQHSTVMFAFNAKIRSLFFLLLCSGLRGFDNHGRKGNEAKQSWTDHCSSFFTSDIFRSPLSFSQLIECLTPV